MGLRHGEDRGKALRSSFRFSRSTDLDACKVAWEKRQLRLGDSFLLQ